MSARFGICVMVATLGFIVVAAVQLTLPMGVVLVEVAGAALILAAVWAASRGAE